MTMREMASTLRTSVPTIYRKLKDAGIDVKDLRDANTGDLTPSGAATIAGLFDGSQASQDVLNAVSQTVSGDSLQDVSGDNVALRIEVEVLRTKLESMETTLEMLRAELDRQRTEAEGMRAERDRLLTMLEAEQQQRQVLMLDGDRRGGSWLRRLFRGRGAD